MLLPLPIMQYVGEEGLYAMKSYEMFVRGDYWHPSILGYVWPHPPLYHWPIIGICQLIGWEHVDIAIRLVSVTASWLSAITVFLTARQLFREHRQAGWLAALVYLSMGEVSFWYGWLGYADATFGFFIFSAIAALWLALEKRHVPLFLLSLILISLAFLTKNFTAYILYSLAGLVLLQRLGRWRLLLHPGFIIPGVAALGVPWLFQLLVVQSGSSNAITTFRDAMRNFSGHGILDYLKHWLTYPLLFAFRAMPVSLVLIWLWLRRKVTFERHPTLVTLTLVLAVCFAPFWVSAGGTPRYLVPLYGLVALLLTCLLLQLEPAHYRLALKAIVVVVILKIPYSLGILPYIKDWRPERDVKAVAVEIANIVGDKPLLSHNDVSTGLAVAAYLDVWQHRNPPIVWDYGKAHGVYVLAETSEPATGELVQKWPLRGDTVYLYWRP